MRRRIYHFGMLLILICLGQSMSATADTPLAPDPTATGIDIEFPSSPGYFINHGCDLFWYDGVDFDGDAESVRPAVVRARGYYDMHIDPAFDGTKKLSAPGWIGIEDRLGGQTVLYAEEGDEILSIDLAAVYDDLEGYLHGGFWANFHVIAYPVTYDPAVDSAPVPTTSFQFHTMLRGPFWSGEKFEIGETHEPGAPTSRFQPQVMYYRNLGIWDWNWTPDQLIQVVIYEGDGSGFDDTAVLYLIRRDNVGAAGVTIADNGSIVSLSLTPDARFKRSVMDADNEWPNSGGIPRVYYNYSGHDLDIGFSTQVLSSPLRASRSFADEYVIGPERIKDDDYLDSDYRPWALRYTNGTSPLDYIDNISYVPGWDCGGFPDFYPYDHDDDFAFSFDASEAGVRAAVFNGGCDDKTSVFFRTNRVLLPPGVTVKRSTVIVWSGTAEAVVLPLNAGNQGFLFTELLDYNTGTSIPLGDGDDDFGFRISVTRPLPPTFLMTVSAFDGNETSVVVVRATLVEWPDDMPGQVSSHTFSWNDTDRFGHYIYDMPPPVPGENYFVINEIREYDPDGDDDVNWNLGFDELSPNHVRFQFGTTGRQSVNSGNAHITALSRIVQFPSSGNLPISYVDAANVGSEDGSPSHPWDSFNEGVSWVIDGGTVRIRPNSYHETLSIGKACRLERWGNEGIVVIGR